MDKYKKESKQSIGFGEVYDIDIKKGVKSMAKFITHSWSFEEEINPNKILKTIERAARTCYKSENKIGEGSAERLIRAAIARGHESILEHEKITVRVITDRGVTHEWVRHRAGASYSQESTRYCRYSDDKFGNELTFVVPVGLELQNLDNPYTTDLRIVWEDAMKKAEQSYMHLIQLGAKPELARGVLPTDVKTEIVITMNIREWRHFFKLRCNPAAHPNIRYIARGILKSFAELLPCLFDDI